VGLGFWLGARVKRGHFVSFRRQIGKWKWRRVSEVEGKNGKVTKCETFLSTTKQTVLLSDLRKSALHSKANSKHCL